MRVIAYAVYLMDVVCIGPFIYRPFTLMTGASKKKEEKKVRVYMPGPATALYPKFLVGHAKFPGCRIGNVVSQSHPLLNSLKKYSTHHRAPEHFTTGQYTLATGM
jgi:hypothetical protein